MIQNVRNVKTHGSNKKSGRKSNTLMILPLYISILCYENKYRSLLVNTAFHINLVWTEFSFRNSNQTKSTFDAFSCICSESIRELPDFWSIPRPSLLWVPPRNKQRKGPKLPSLLLDDSLPRPLERLIKLTPAGRLCVSLWHRSSLFHWNFTATKMAQSGSIDSTYRFHTKYFTNHRRFALF